MTQPGSSPVRNVLLLTDHHARSGIGRYVASLYQAMRQESAPDLAVRLLAQNVPRHAELSSWLGLEAAAGHPDEALVQRRPWWAKQSGYGKLYQWTGWSHFPRQIPSGYALYHFSSQMMGGGVRRAEPAVVTVHDLIAVRLKRDYGSLAGMLRRRHLAAVKGARGLIFISEFSRRDFLSLSEFPEERTAVIPHGVGPPFGVRDRLASRAALALPEDRPILLHVGSEEPRKGVGTLLAALDHLRRHSARLLLVRIGARSRRATRLINSLGLEDHVTYAGAQSEERLALHYSAADALVFPSTYEGFGLPLLEAMASGLPVVASAATAIPEITGPAAILVPPGDVEGLALALERVLGDEVLARRLAESGLRRASDFTWASAASRTLQFYRTVLGWETDGVAGASSPGFRVGETRTGATPR